MDLNQTVGKLLEDFYRKSNFSDDSSVVHWIHVQIGPLRFPFPNPGQRREVIWLHDLTHLLTGYDTSWTGEGEIAAWELASGFPLKHWIGYFYAPITFSIGLIVAPVRTLRAFRLGIGQKNVYKLQLESSQLKHMTVADLKKALDS
jgi:hypothetical protein